MRASSPLIQSRQRGYCQRPVQQRIAVSSKRGNPSAVCLHASLAQRVQMTVAPGLLAAVLLLSPSPAQADLVQVGPPSSVSPNARPSTLPTPPLLLQTVPLSQATEAAKPLPKQTIDKGKVWQYFIGGAVTLFLGTIALENYEGWFPAISRANKAMAASRQSAQQGSSEAGVIDVAPTPQQQQAAWQEQEAALQAAEAEAEAARQAQLVAAGLAEARAKAAAAAAAEQSRTAAPQDQQQAVAAPAGSEAATPASSSSGPDAVSASTMAAAAPAAAHAAADASDAPSASSSSSSTKGAAGNGHASPPAAPAAANSTAAAPGAAAGYAVVTSEAAAGAAPVSWEEAAGGSSSSSGSAGAVSPQRLAGLMEGQAALKEFRAAQQAGVRE